MPSIVFARRGATDAGSIDGVLTLDVPWTPLARVEVLSGAFRASLIPLGRSRAVRRGGMRR